MLGEWKPWHLVAALCLFRACQASGGAGTSLGPDPVLLSSTKKAAPAPLLVRRTSRNLKKSKSSPDTTPFPTVGSTPAPSPAPVAPPTPPPTLVPTSTPPQVAGSPPPPPPVPTFSPVTVITIPGPTPTPVSSPTPAPVSSPTLGPSPAPVALPDDTVSPTTPAPVPTPTLPPSPSPIDPPGDTVSPSTSTPTPAPTTAPTNMATTAPTTMPSTAPSTAPTVFGSSVPSIVPTVIDSSVPSIVPTLLPTGSPSINPTGLTPTVSLSPSLTASNLPSAVPTLFPTTSPSSNPSGLTPTVSLSPSLTASSFPSLEPSFPPSLLPSSSPSKALIGVPIGTTNMFFVVQDGETVNLALVEQEVEVFMTDVVEVVADCDTFVRSEVAVSALSSGQLRASGDQVSVTVLSKAFFLEEPYPTSLEMTGAIESYFSTGTGYADLEADLMGIANLTDLSVSIVGETIDDPRDIEPVELVEVPLEAMNLFFVVEDGAEVNSSLVEEDIGSFMETLIDASVDEYDTFVSSNVTVQLVSSDLRRVVKKQFSASILSSAFFTGEPHPTSSEVTDAVRSYFGNGTGYDDLESSLISNAGLGEVMDLSLTIGGSSIDDPRNVNNTDTPSGAEEPESNDSDTNGALIGGLVIGGVVLVAAVVAVLWIARKKSSESDPPGDDAMPDQPAESELSKKLETAQDVGSLNSDEAEKGVNISTETDFLSMSQVTDDLNISADAGADGSTY